jgi:hypothetical protein
MGKEIRSKGNAAPVRNKGPQKAKGNPTKNGGVFGKWQGRRQIKKGA